MYVNFETGGYVYIMASQMVGTLYIGVTSNLIKRVSEHKAKITKGFTSKYGVDRLVYYEALGSIEDAIAREKQLKGWHREWKIKLIEGMNPTWNDLFPQITGDWKMSQS